MNPENKFEPQQSKSPREIEAAIGDTRNALTDDIKALSDKASPANLKHEAKQAIKSAKDSVVEKAVEKSVEVKDVVVDKALEIKDIAVEKATEATEIAMEKAHEASEAISEAVDEVATRSREIGRVAWQFTMANAVPLSLIGLGAGLLLANRRSQSTRVYRNDQSWADDVEASDYPTADYPAADYPADNLAFATADSPAGTYPSSAYPARRSTAVARRGPKADRPSALNKAGSRLRAGTKSAYDKAEHGLEEAQHKLADTASHTRDVLQERFQRVQRASREFANANPLALAFGTLVAGVGVGLLLPTTAREDKLLEPARTRIRSAIGTAREVAEDVTDVAKQTARDTVGRATGSTQTSSSTSNQISGATLR